MDTKLPLKAAATEMPSHRSQGRWQSHFRAQRNTQTDIAYTGLKVAARQTGPRVPGDRFRALARVLKNVPGIGAPEKVVAILSQRLRRDGVRIATCTLRRQISGFISSVPKPFEQTLESMAAEMTGLSEESLEAALRAEGYNPDASPRETLVPIEEVSRLADVWLGMNPGKSKRALAFKLRDRLAAAEVDQSVSFLQTALGGKRHRHVRIELRDALQAELATLGVLTEQDVEERIEELGLGEGAQPAKWAFTDAEHFRALIRIWKTRFGHTSSRQLGEAVQVRLENEGYEPSLGHLQRLIDRTPDKIRVRIVQAVEETVRERYPDSAAFEAALKVASADDTSDADRAWVSVSNVVALAQKWKSQNPDKSLRQLAIALAKTAEEIGFPTSTNTLQPILGGWKKRTRGFVLRALELLMKRESRGLEVVGSRDATTTASDNAGGASNARSKTGRAKPTKRKGKAVSKTSTSVTEGPTVRQTGQPRMTTTSLRRPLMK